MTRYRKGVVLIGLCFVVTILGFQGVAFADGMKLPPKWVKQLPAIPTQRAIIVHKDGQEQLIIESSLDGEGDEFAWIVPVPASPMAFEATTPGFIKTLSLNLQARVITSWNIRGGELALAVAAWFVFVLLADMRSWLRAGGLLLLILFLAAISMPVLLRSRESGPDSGRGVEGMRVEQSHQIGSYDLCVLEAETPEALNAWLDDNGYLGVPQEGVDVVQNYIDNGWRFVAARLRRDTVEGLSEPHPVSITFPAEQPVYPMRLTALAQSELYLELFVIADQRAEHPLLTTETADSYQPKTSLKFSRWDDEPQSHKGMAGTRFGVELGHPDATKLMWPDCMVTKLTGTLTPGKMKEDYHLTFVGRNPCMRVLYSPLAAEAHAKSTALQFWILLLPSAILLLLKVGRTREKRMTLRISVAVLIVVVCFFMSDLRLPRSSIVRMDDYRLLRDDGSPDFDVPEYLGNKANLYHQFASWSSEQIAGFMTLCVHFDEQLGESSVPPLRVEDSPGNFTMSVEEQGLVLHLYDSAGTPEVIAIDQVVPPREPGRSANSKHALDLESLAQDFNVHPSPEAAYELAICGDARVIDYLRKEVHRTGSDYDFLSWQQSHGRLALARLALGIPQAVPALEKALISGKTGPEGRRFDFLSNRICDALSDFSSQATRNALDAIGGSYSLFMADKLFEQLYYKDLAWAAKVFFERLERDRKNYALKSNEILFDVLALSRATGIPIPMNYHEPAGMDNFARSVQLWIEEHPIEALQRGENSQVSLEGEASDEAKASQVTD